MISKWWRCDPRYQSDEQLEELTGVCRNVFDLLNDWLEPRWLDLQAERLEKERVLPRIYARGGGAVGLEFSSRLFVVLVFPRSNQSYRMIQATHGHLPRPTGLFGLFSAQKWRRNRQMWVSALS